VDILLPVKSNLEAFVGLILGMDQSVPVFLLANLIANFALVVVV
jgi:hypothetical protein